MVSWAQVRATDEPTGPLTASGGVGRIRVEEAHDDVCVAGSKFLTEFVERR
jgi:hypothetical protein